jgi:hypothetical protein
MKCAAATIFFIFSTSLFAQKAGVQIATVTTHARPGSIANSTSTSRPDLDVLLADLEGMTVATKGDIADLEIEKWKSGSPIAWLKRGSHKQEAKQLAASLESNLTQAMPGLISDAQDSRGSMSTSFKLYNDLSAVVESLGALAELSNSSGRKEVSTSLHNDYAVLGRIRQELASFIQLTADSLEPVDRTPRPGSPPSYGAVLSASKRVPRGTMGR